MPSWLHSRGQTLHGPTKSRETPPSGLGGVQDTLHTHVSFKWFWGIPTTPTHRSTNLAVKFGAKWRVPVVARCRSQ